MREFRLTENHIKLLRRAYVGWQDCEFGAPEINPKRPYGNSDVINDIAKILDITEPHNEDGEFSSAVEQNLGQIHMETETALQIILFTGEFRPGLYRSEDYRRDWKRVGD